MPSAQRTLGRTGPGTYARVVSTRRTGISASRQAETQPVHSITSAQGPLGEDIDRRARRYLAQMVVRTLCFLGAVLTWGVAPTWLSVTLLIGAVVLPYVAVVLANAGRERPERADSFMELRGIGAGPVPGPWEPVVVPQAPRPTPAPTPAAGGPRGPGGDGSVRD